MKATRSIVSLSCLFLLTACGGDNNLAAPYGSTYGMNSPYGSANTMQSNVGMMNSLPATNVNPSVGITPSGTRPAAQTVSKTAVSTATRSGESTSPSTSTVKTGSASTKKTTSTATTKKSTTASKTAVSEEAQVAQYLQKANQAFASLQSLSATISNFEHGIQDGQGQVRYLYKKPGQVKIDVLSSSESGKAGVKLSYATGSSQVKVRPTGMLSLIAVTMNMSDSKLKSGRQYLLSQIDLTATVNRLTAPGTRAKVLGKTQMEGTDIMILEITPTGHFDGRVTKEHLGLDMQTFLPRVHEMYEGDKMVYAARITQMQVNPTLPGNAFDI